MMRGAPWLQRGRRERERGHPRFLPRPLVRFSIGKGVAKSFFGEEDLMLDRSGLTHPPGCCRQTLSNIQPPAVHGGRIALRGLPKAFRLRALCLPACSQGARGVWTPFSPLHACIS
jgi:hypothetical protein